MLKRAYTIPYGTIVIIEEDNVDVPPTAPEVNKGDIVKILGLNGMYVNCINQKTNEHCYIDRYTSVETEIDQ